MVDDFFMNIAHFTNTYKPNVNGVSRSVSSFRKALTSLGHNVFVFAPGARKYEDREPFIFRYAAVEIPQFNYAISLPVSSYVNWVLPRLKPDVIHSNHPLWLGDVAARKAEKMELPLVFTFHTRYTEYTHYVPLDQAFVKGVFAEWLARYLRRCQHVVTPSESIREILAEHGVTERVTTIPTGIDLKPFQQADGTTIRARFGWEKKIVLLSIGRLAKEKNWERLLEAVAIVMSKHDDIRLALIGDGPYRAALEKYAASLGVADKVMFVGRVPMDAVPSYLKVGDLFVYASLTETQGLVTMEAMAAGLTVVAVDATGTRDVVQNGEDGLLTNNDSQALADGILRVLENPQLRERLETNVKTNIQRFDLLEQARKLLAVYEQAIEDKKTGYVINVENRLYT
jgi:glycosyltransferase involved in cell wall biosynthesis